MAANLAARPHLPPWHAVHYRYCAYGGKVKEQEVNSIGRRLRGSLSSTGTRPVVSPLTLMKVKVVHRLGWLELFDLQLVGTDDGRDKRTYLLQSGRRRGRSVLYRVPGGVQLDPKSPIPPEAVTVYGDERMRVLHAVGEADNGWDGDR